MRDCPACAGSGRLRQLGIVGSPKGDKLALVSAALDAAGIRSGDTVVTTSDLVQVLMHDRGVKVIREREKSIDQIIAEADEVIDLRAVGVPVETVEQRRERKEAARKAAAAELAPVVVTVTTPTVAAPSAADGARVKSAMQEAAKVEAPSKRK